jgi:hypothetical protein
MRRAGVSGVMRRLWPRRMRVRLAVMYAVLFLLAGIALLALTYTLVAHVLLPAPSTATKVITPQEGELLGLCKQSEQPGARRCRLRCARVATRRSPPSDPDRRTASTRSLRCATRR